MIENVSKEMLLRLIGEYINSKNGEKTWTPGKDWVHYSGPYFDSDEITRAANALLEGWLVLGKDAISFEEEFPPLLGKTLGIVTNSGSSSNLLMMAAMKKLNLSDKPGVIIPAAGFPTTINPVLQLGFNPTWVDIELDTLNIDLDGVEAAAKWGACKYITFAHVLGNPPNMDRLMEIVKKYDLILLEDCCDALGTTYDGKLLGSFGRMASCSFYPAHHMTMGEGGFVACDDPNDAKLLRSLREWGRGCYCVGKVANLSMKGCCGRRFSEWLPSLPGEVFDHKYVYDNIGFNLKPIELQCSMGLAQIKKLPFIHQRRKENHARLTKIFSPYEEFFHFHRAQPKADVSWFAFPLTIKDGAPFKRSQLTTFFESKKIQTRTYFGGNLLLQPAYAGYASPEEARSFKVATKVTTDTFFLGTSPVITSEQLDYIEQVTQEFVKSL